MGHILPLWGMLKTPERERGGREVWKSSLCTYLFCAAATYKKFIEAIVCVADYLQYVHSHRSSVHINYFGTGPKARDCDAGTGMWTERTRRQLRQETARTHTTHTHTLAQLTSQFSAHNARKCQDPSKNGDEEEAEDELEDEPEHEEDAAKRRVQLCLQMQTKLCLWKVT